LIFKDAVFYHIGSTAVKGIKAKPTIDIMIVVGDLESADNSAEEMEKLGYTAEGEFGIKGRRYFHKGSPQHSHHIHVFESGSSHIRRHLNFRDYMNSHPKKAEKYSKLKEKLAEKYRYDPQKYSQGKNDFIKEVEAAAEKRKDN